LRFKSILPYGKISYDPGKTAPDSEPDLEQVRVEYVPRPGLLGITISNWLLNIVTLSIWRFWGKTRVRRHIWSCIHVNGEPLDYTGRGIELFLGALFVFLVLVLPIIVISSVMNLALGQDHPALALIQVFILLGVAALWGAAIYRARRYQLSRTLWRGIRGTLDGSTVSFTLLHLGSILARVLTLGWSTPTFNLKLQRRLVGDVKFGNKAFCFDGRSGPLYPGYAACWFLTLIAIALLFVAVGMTASGIFRLGAPTELGDILNSHKPVDPSTQARMALTAFSIVAGAIVSYFILLPLVWTIYVATEMRVFASYTSLESTKFRLEATRWSLFGLTVGNLLISILTLSVGMPFVYQRTVRYFCDRLTVEGTIDFSTVKQSDAAIGRYGEGLAATFDIGGL
jgi:uncharacterized membrane protein YjgN (DUF898 family)